MLENMLKRINQFGTTFYPPILDNYPQYEELKVQENVVKQNSNQSVQFSSGIEAGRYKTKLIDVFERLQLWLKRTFGPISLATTKLWKWP